MGSKDFTESRTVVEATVEAAGGKPVLEQEDVKALLAKLLSPERDIRAAARAELSFSLRICVETLTALGQAFLSGSPEGGRLSAGIEIGAVLEWLATSGEGARKALDSFQQLWLRDDPVTRRDFRVAFEDLTSHLSKALLTLTEEPEIYHLQIRADPGTGWRRPLPERGWRPAVKDDVIMPPSEKSCELRGFFVEGSEPALPPAQAKDSGGGEWEEYHEPVYDPVRTDVHLLVRRYFEQIDANSD